MILLEVVLGTIPVHIHSGAILLLHPAPVYTIKEAKAGPYKLLISLSSNKDNSASGTAYLNDGISFPLGPSAILSVIQFVKGHDLTV